MTGRDDDRSATGIRRVAGNSEDVATAMALAELHRKIFTGAPWDAASFTRLMQRQGAMVLVAVGGAGAVDGQSGLVFGGFILCQAIAGEAEILTLGVASDRRRCGTGRRLLEAAVAELRAEGVTRLFLEVAEDNTAALALYRSTGFQDCGRRAAYYVQGRPVPVDALVLARTIVAHPTG